MSVGAQPAKLLPAITRDQALAALADGATLVSGNRRLARSLRQRYHAERLEAGALAWTAPAILPWEAWSAELWTQAQRLSGNKQLLRLSAHQELLVWERIVGDSAGDRLLAIEETAQLARDAWALWREWRLDRTALQASQVPDVLQFTQWADAFAAACDRQGWIDGARAIAALPSMLDAVELPEAVIFAGFDEWTPTQQALLTALRQKGVALQAVESAPDRNQHCLRSAFATPRDELLAAARWARELVDAGEPGPIGVVVPDLAARRSEAERVFREAFDAPSLVAGGLAAEGLFQISAGAPLARYPLIRSALLGLRLQPDKTDLATVSAWLRSEYVAGGEAERGARAVIDRGLRKKGLPEVSLRDLLRPDSRDLRLYGALQQWIELQGRLPASAPPASWAGVFSELWGALSSLDEQPSQGVDRQVLREWNELLVDFAALGATSASMSFGEALRLLERLAAERMFQPEGEAGPVEVLGLLEASGAEFSHLWVARLDDETWPAEARPNPFLPYHLQRERGLPHASPERELNFAQTRLRNLIAGAPTVRISWAGADGDRELGPSSLIADIPETDAAVPAQTLVQAVRANTATKSIDDSAGPSLGPDEPARGGSNIFAHQAHCPFRAFAQLRLGAEALPSATPGLDALDRGTLVHELLEYVWRELGGSAGLARADLADVAERGARAALARLSEKRGAGLPERFKRMERQRLVALAVQWLEIERARTAPFRVVEAERKRMVSVGGLTLNVVIDRIDELEDGRHVLIDYKTGSPKPAEWDKKRPLEPQVPLYAVTHPEPVAAALFAKLKLGEMGFKGASEEEVDLAAKSRSYDHVLNSERLRHWRQSLEGLARDFLQGAAAVDPRDAKCGFCEMGPLCRVGEIGAAADDDGDGQE